MTTSATSIAFGLFRAADAPTFLRRLLAFDAITSGAMGVKLVIGAGFLSPLLGLPVPLLRGAGLVLVPFALVVAVIAAKAPASRRAVLGVAAVNAIWVAASLGLIALGLAAPTMLGIAFVAAQAVFVGILAELQVIGARSLRQP